jgi:hypothetical protein
MSTITTLVTAHGSETTEPGVLEPGVLGAGVVEDREAGAASAEYAAVTACGVGIAGVLMKLLTSDFGQALLEKVLNFFLSMIGIG